MNTLGKILLGTGILLLLAGVAGAGLTYREIRTENLMHATVGTVRVPFADTLSSASAGFLPYREGRYTLYLSAPVPGDLSDRTTGRTTGGCGPGSILAGISGYGGVVEVRITDPDGGVALERTILPGNPQTTADTGNGWIPLDTLGLPASERQWMLGVTVRPEGSPPPACGMELFLLPPQRYDIGAYLEEGVLWLVGFGGCMLAGFVMIVIAARVGR